MRKTLGKQGRSTARVSLGRRVLAFVAAAALAVVLVPAALGGTPVSLPGFPLVAAAADTDEAEIANSSTGTAYESLSDALSAVNEGDTLTLNSDLSASEALTSDKPFTLDLAGHKLTIEAGSDASAGSNGDGAALVLNASGTTTVKDSSGNGSLVLNVGAEKENARTYRNGYQGIYVGNGGTLSVEDASIEVTYTGSWTVSSSFIFTLTGIGAGSGSSVELSGASKLDVKGAPSDGSHGATVVRGLYGESGASNLTTGDSVKVSADANSAVFTNGSTLYPGYASYRNESSGTGYIELNLDQNDTKQKAIYDEIQEAFKKSAKVDTSTDKAGYVSGTNIYYAEGLWLSNEQVEVWAASDQVADEDIGDLDKIVATHIFVHATNTVAKQEAYGITVASDFSGTIDQAGSTDASVVQGDAFAVFQSAIGTWNLDENKLSANADDATYCLRGNSFNLADYVDISPTPSSAVTYPVGETAYEVDEVKSESLKTATIGTDYQETVTDGTAGWESLFPETPDEVKVTFTGMKDSSGDDVDDTAVTTNYNATLSSNSVSAPQVADYTDGSTTYRFVGWECSSPSGRGYVYQPSYVNDGLVFDSQVAGAASAGASTLTAHYVAVDSGESLVAFNVQGAVYAYAAENGSTPSYQEADTTATSSSPSALTEPYGYDLSFHGWYEGTSDDSIWSDSRTCITGTLPSVAADATYTALFDQTVAYTNLSFVYLGSDGSSTTSSKTNYDWTTGQETEIANSLVKSGDTVIVNGEVHTFLGWGPRESDKTPTWTTEFPTGYGGNNGLRASSAIYYAIYSTSTFSATVNFYVGSTLYATSSDVSSDATIRDAFLASSNPTNPTSSDSDLSFLEWNTSAKSTNRLYNSLTTIGEIDADASDTVNLYATWEKREYYYTVTFYDSDRKTVLAEYSILKGDTVASSEGNVTAKAKGKLFKGWATASGKRVNLNTLKITKNTKLYAVYRVLNSGGSSPSNSINVNGNGHSGATAQTNNKIVLPNASNKISGISSSKSGSGDSGGSAISSSGNNGNSSSNGNSSQASDNSDSSQSSLGNSNVNNAPAVAALIAVLIVLILALVRWLLGRRDRAEDTDEGVLQLGDMKIRF